MNDIVIYTVLVGETYDSIKQFPAVSSKSDYICFVKKGQCQEKKIGIWRICEIEDDLMDNGRLSRIPKLLPHKTLLTRYKYSLYIDANITILDDYVYNRIDELISDDIKLALLKHPFRDCVYQEAYVCVAGQRGGWLDILRQIFFLKMNGYPKHNGLYEANLIFRNHNDPDVIKMDDLWWKTFMKYSKRDQLSLVYALKVTGLKPVYFLEPGFTVRNHPAFEYNAHLSQNKSSGLKGRIVASLYGISKKILKE